MALSRPTSRFGRFKRNYEWVLPVLYVAFEFAGGVVLSNSAHTVDNSHVVWKSLFPGQSKLPAALTYLPVFSLATWLVAAFLGSGLPVYRMAVLHSIPLTYMLKWMKTWFSITNPGSPFLWGLLFLLDLLLCMCQMAYLPGTVRLEDGGIPLCLLDCPKRWADEADLIDEQSSEDDELSNEDVPAQQVVLQQQAKHEFYQGWFGGSAAFGNTRRATGVVSSLLCGFWPLSSHGQGPKGVGVSPAVSSARPRHSSGLGSIYQQAHAKGVFNQKIANAHDSASGRGPAAAVTALGAAVPSRSASSADPANPRAAAPSPGRAPSPPSAPGWASGDVPASPTNNAHVIGGGVTPLSPIRFTTHPKLHPGSSGPGAAKTSGRPITKATAEMDIRSSDPSEGLIPACRAPSSYPLGKAPGMLSQEPSITTGGQESLTGGSQEAAPQPQPKLEKQGSGLKDGLKKVKNGVRNMTNKVKGQTSRRRNQTPGPVPTPAALPAQGSTSTGSELQRGGSLKDKLKKRFSRSRRGQELFV
ncbi:TPA: hypothetical protein ACH3X2_011916 [Trebouxia sp. C0005]